MTKQDLIATAQAFATHPNLEHGDDVGFHDIETSIFADFNGSFDFGDHDHNVFYDLTITDDGARARA